MYFVKMLGNTVSLCKLRSMKSKGEKVESEKKKELKSYKTCGVKILQNTGLSRLFVFIWICLTIREN